MTVTDVSVVIPTTLRRAGQLDRAIRSALEQTAPPAEVIVVIDRPIGELSGWDRDVRVRAIRNDRRPGPGGARNAGICAATHGYVAFLDDDDHWLPSKLETQLTAIEALPAATRARTIVASRALVVDGGGTRRCPLELRFAGQSVVTYLFEPSVIRRPQRAIYTPTIVAPTNLALEQPFDESLVNWEDADWMIRVLDGEGVQLLHCDEHLAVIDQTRFSGRSLSGTASADTIDEWAARVLKPRSVKAYHNFLLTHVSRALVDADRRRDALRLGRDVLSDGRFDRDSATEFVAFVVMSNRQRARLRGLRGRLRGRPRPASHAPVRAP